MIILQESVCDSYNSKFTFVTSLSEVVFCVVGFVVTAACIEVHNYIRGHSVPYSYMVRNGNKGHIDSWLKCC